MFFFVEKPNSPKCESCRPECLAAIRNLLVGLEASAAMKHAEIYKGVKPYMTHSDWRVKSAAALCIGQLAKVKSFDGGD